MIFLFSELEQEIDNFKKENKKIVNIKKKLQLDKDKLAKDLADFDNLRETEKKKNHLNTISKIMGTLVQPQLCTFSYREALLLFTKPRYDHTIRWLQYNSNCNLFSKAGNTVTPKNANLNPDKVEERVIVRNNLRLFKSIGLRH